MNYDLALKLKNAGFPQGASLEGRFYNKDGVKGFTTYTLHEEVDGATVVFIPTLEELIEACGVDFHSLEHWVEDDGTEGFVAFPMSAMFQSADGKTPTEAVANLWLALHTNLT